MFPGSSESKPRKDKDEIGLAELQAAVTQLWNDWKKFQALPFDEDDESTMESNEDFGSIPNMVLVEVDGVRMFYPSCYVGILADQMVFDNKQSRIKNDSFEPSKGNVSGGSSTTNRHVDSLSTSELDLSFGDRYGENLPSGSGLTVEDVEVEEILKSNIPGVPGSRSSPPKFKGT